ncbi:MAG: rhamnogalacturonan lyase, partial [Lachnospiraceae bacterium]|nr:rhamnogalacturonan lyase [Lachnospiraceae bacterium]
MESIQLKIREVKESLVTLEWDAICPKKAARSGEGGLNSEVSYRVYWADRYSPQMEYKCLATTEQNTYTLRKSTHIPHYVYVEAVSGEDVIAKSDLVKTPVGRVLHEQLEKLSRGLIAVKVKEGVFLSWRLFLDEVTGYTKTGMSGTDFIVYKNGERLAEVTDSTNYLDPDGTAEDEYAVAAVSGAAEAPLSGEEMCNSQAGENCSLSSGEERGHAQNGERSGFSCCKAVKPWNREAPYTEIPLQKPEGGVTPAGQAFTYSANDMSVGDVDGDGEYEFFVKWDPSNAHDVSHRGYTGHCLIDCYKLDGRLLWRLDMGDNIRAGAHYTQFIVYDFDGDGKAEMSVKTAPGTRMTVFNEDGSVKSSRYITLAPEDEAKGVTNQDNYVCNAEDYYEHLANVFTHWQDHPQVKAGQWPSTVEECIGLTSKYTYPLNEADARELTDYFMDVYAPSLSDKNKLREFEGFIYEGPEYLTMFAGTGEEIETIPFPHPRADDGLKWLDCAILPIEPSNREDRFLSGVAYLDGERPYLVICRGYYTRTTIVAYDFFERKHRVKFDIDSGYIPMDNPFHFWTNHKDGTDPVYGCIAGQGDHSLATADVDGDGCQEIIYGAAVIDHDGSVLYSAKDYLPDGRFVKLGHGDSMHVAVIDPDRPGYQIFNVFEEGKDAPYGWALRDAETGKAFFGEYAEKDLGRCLIGDVSPNVRGLSVWVNDVYDCKGNKLPDKPLSTNANIRWAADLTTQVIDGADYQTGEHIGVINDNTHGEMLRPEGTLTNTGTKGNPGLSADVFGDFREEILLRTEDSSAIRIYTNTKVTQHKLFTLMHDTMYRTGIAWQNNCYNQPCYTKFYYASDMDFSQVLPWLEEQ